MEQKTIFKTQSSKTVKKSHVDMSKYTVVDHLDEDKPPRGQEYCIFSFLSPEGIMNCNVRALKFRGAYSTMEEAQKAAEELEKTDKYFKIFIGESGKWLEFDPPESRVEKEMSSNKDQQQMINARRQQRMEKLNTLAGKHKENVDKKDAGKEERAKELQKAGVAASANESNTENKKNILPTVVPPVVEQPVKQNEPTKDRLRRRLAEKRAKENENTVENNIENIKKLMAKKQ